MGCFIHGHKASGSNEGTECLDCYFVRNRYFTLVNELVYTMNAVWSYYPTLHVKAVTMTARPQCVSGQVDISSS